MIKKSSFLMLVIVLLTGVLASGLTFVPVQAQTSAGNTCIVAPPAEKGFPQVQVQFRAFDSSYHAVQNLTTAGIKIAENNRDIPNYKLTTNANGVGLNLFFVVDQGNRTNQTLVKAILERYGDAFMADGLDSAAIITDLTLPAPSFHTYQEKTNSKTRFVNAASKFPSADLSKPLSSVATIREAISQIRSLNGGCARPSAIILLSGEDVELYQDTSVVSSVIADATSLGISIHVVHLPNPLGSFAGDTVFKQLSSGTKGIYTQAKNAGTQTYTGIDQELFQKLLPDRTTYTAEFRSSDGSSGDHIISVLPLGQSSALAANQARFTVKIDPMKLTIVSPNDGLNITRTAKNIADPYEWDITTQRVEFAVEFPDKFTRQLKTADLKQISSTGTQTVMSITPGSGAQFQMDWDLKETKNVGGSFSLQIWATDELGIESKSNIVTLQIAAVVPTPQGPGDTPGGGGAPGVIPWALIVGGGGLAILIVSIIAVSAIRKASRKIPNSTPGDDQVTVTPGKDGMGPLASICVLSGPMELRGQKIMITQPMVTLGRGSTADIQFKLGDHTTVSREHVVLSKSDRGWTISPVVRAKGGTILNGQKLSNGEIYPLQNGDHVQLGMVGYNHIEFEFLDEDGSEHDTSITMVPGEGELIGVANAAPRRNYGDEDGETKVEPIELASSISPKDRERILRKVDKSKRSDDDWLNSL